MPWVAATGQFRGELYEVWVEAGDRSGKLWDAEADSAPLTTKEVTRIARSSLRAMMGAKETLFGCQEVSLRRHWMHISEKKSSWYFLVVFESDDESLIFHGDGPGFEPAILPFVVFADGSVQLPVKKKKLNPQSSVSP